MAGSATQLKRRALLGGAAAGMVRVARAAEPVDLLLVLAVDISRSVVERDAHLQRDGYRAAMRDPQVVAAMTGGPAGCIAVAYIEWAAFERQELLLPWTRIGSRADGVAWGDALTAKPWSSLPWTSLSGALRYSGSVLDAAPFTAERRVIDVSGDGVNNNGPPAEGYRDALVERGVVINGLPIINDRPRFGRPNGAELVPYYRDSVTGGPGHFTIVAEGFDTFADAIRRKLLAEIA